MYFYILGICNIFVILDFLAFWIIKDKFWALLSIAIENCISILVWTINLRIFWLCHYEYTVCANAFKFNFVGEWCSVLWTNPHVSGSLFSTVWAFWCLFLFNPNLFELCFFSFFIFLLLEIYVTLPFWLIIAAVNIKGVFNTSNETKYEKDPPDGILKFRLYSLI